MSSQTETFFENYANALNIRSAQELAHYHLVPCVFMVDESKNIYHDMADIEGVFKRLLNAFESRRIVSYAPQVNQAIRLSENILFANVRWQFCNSEKETVISCHCSYTLQQVDENKLKIIVEVIDDEDNVISSLMQGNEV